MSVDPKRTAVVLIEYQNDFPSEAGPCTARCVFVDAHQRSKVLRQTPTSPEGSSVAVVARGAGRVPGSG